MYIVKLCSRKVILYSISNSTVVNTCLQQSLTESKYEGQSSGEQWQVETFTVDGWTMWSKSDKQKNGNDCKHY